MKKILKNNMATPIKCQCKDCGSLFEFDYTDIQRREEASYAFLYGSNTFTVRYVVCPVCAYENKFEDIKKDSIKLENNHPWETENPDVSKKVEEEYNAETSLK